MTYEEVSRRFTYNPETGKLHYAENTKRSKVGDEAGSLTGEGYLYVGFKSKVYSVARIAWLLYHKQWPDLTIDHINGIRTDNRIANLRHVSKRDNLRGYQRARSFLSNRRGVSWDMAGQKWRVRVRGKYIGRYYSLEEATEAYNNAGGR